jgi:arabinofuranosyltransferase
VPLFSSQLARKRLQSIVTVGIVVLLVARIGWLSDDSLITLRTVLNLAHGWGPGFNVSESVQSYTHPLWFLLWLALGWLSDQWIGSVIFMSLLATALALVVVIKISDSRRIGYLLLFLLVLSNSFMEYSSSGLENPLSHLVVGMLLIIVAQQHRPKRTSDGALAGLVFALVVLTRFDLLLLVAPVLLVWIAQAEPRSRVTASVSVGLPIVTWLLWCYITYGYLLPNTFLAKRNLDIDALDLGAQGLFYLRMSFVHDPAGALTLFAGIAISVLARNLFSMACSAGTDLYLAYVVSNGGDFMVGRFLSVPVYLTVILIAISIRDLLAQSGFSRKRRFRSDHAVIQRVAVPAVALALGVALLPSAVSVSREQSPRFNWERPESRGIADERPEFVQKGNSFTRYLREFPEAVSSRFDSTLLDSSIVQISRRANGWPRRSDSILRLPLRVEARCGLLGGKQSSLVLRCTGWIRVVSRIG